MYVDGASLTESNVNLPNVVYFGFTPGTNDLRRSGRPSLTCRSAFGTLERLPR